MFENLTKEQAEQKEIELIAEYKSNQRAYGYNIDNGGSSIGKHSEETKKKIGSFHLGKTISEETREKLRNANLGSKHSIETKKKMSESHKGEKAYWYGKHLSEEAKEKLSEINSIPVICIETNVCYPSAKIAGEILNVCSSNIGCVCKGKRKTAGGYHFKYAS